MTTHPKRVSLVECKWVSVPSGPSRTKNVAHLTSVSDARWSGVIFEPPAASIALDGPAHDVYVLRGQVTDAEGAPYGPGSFLRRPGNTRLAAGSSGATLLVYRHALSSAIEATSMEPHHLVWLPGSVEGMRTATLVSTEHDVMLVSWRRGTKVSLHEHPTGEEIFVLHGELRDQSGRYPEGTWQRLHPKSTHRPYANVETLILLRNGHLGP